MDTTLEHQQVYKHHTIMIWRIDANGNRLFTIGNKEFNTIKEAKQSIDNRKSINELIADHYKKKDL